MRRDLWQADHITPVSEGGGLCGLVRAWRANVLCERAYSLRLRVNFLWQENMRTLCVLCHDAESAALAPRNAARRAAKRKAPRRASEEAAAAAREAALHDIDESVRHQVLHGDSDFEGELVVHDRAKARGATAASKKATTQKKDKAAPG